ncbi:MAG TPA: hypothetical protein VKX17_08790 [Planctomycetota bacterium]|nr:hypothetical protein [Planctomycetota bacterium]
MFKAIDVWKRIDARSAACYRCFESLAKHGYCVQSRDIYQLPFDSQQVQNLEKQFVELFCEEVPDARAVLYSTLEEAIERFDAEFGCAQSINSLDTQNLIARALIATHGNTAEAAKMLGLPKPTVKIFRSKLMKQGRTIPSAVATTVHPE